MEPELEILIWDDDFDRVRTVYRKCGTHSIRKAIDAVDFINSLSRKPKLVILNKIERFTEDDIAETLADRLTEGANVIICTDDKDYRLRIKACLRRHDVNATSFPFSSLYLWVSIYNIIK